MVLEVGQVEALQVREQVVAHLVLDVACRDHGQVAAERLEQRLDDGQADDREAQLDDQVEVGLAQVVDDLADEHRRQGRHEGARDGQGATGDQPRLVTTQVEEQRLARGGV